MSKEEWLTSVQYELDSLYPDIYFSTTSRVKMLQMSAEKRFKYFFKHLNNPEGIFFKKRIFCWTFFDKPDKRGSVHIHSLINGIDPTLAVLLQKKCKGFFGQSKVRPYDHSLPRERLASHYLAEKVVRGELEHYDFYKINSKLRM